MTITQIDFAILDAIQNIFKCSFCDIFFKLVTKFGDGGIFWIITSVILVFPKKTRALGITMIVSLLVCFGVFDGIIKNLVGRLRPFQQNPDFQILIGVPHGSSFPSGHTATAFCAATVYFLFRKENGLAKIVWIPVTVLSVLIMFSRLYLYVHFPTDVLCGALLGIIFGTAGYLVYRKISSRRVKEE